MISENGLMVYRQIDNAAIYLPPPELVANNTRLNIHVKGNTCHASLSCGEPQ